MAVTPENDLENLFIQGISAPNKEYDAVFITNMHDKDEEIVKQAAKDTGFDIQIKRPARDMHGGIVKGFAVHAIRDRDFKPFWDRVDELRKERDDREIDQLNFHDSYTYLKEEHENCNHN